MKRKLRQAERTGSKSKQLLHNGRVKRWDIRHIGLRHRIVSAGYQRYRVTHRQYNYAWVSNWRFKMSYKHVNLAV